MCQVFGGFLGEVPDGVNFVLTALAAVGAELTGEQRSAIGASRLAMRAMGVEPARRCANIGPPRNFAGACSYQPARRGCPQTSIGRAS